MSFFIHLFILITIFIILSSSLNLALGYTGLINLGHIAFFGIGAYSSAILTKFYHLPFLLSLLTAGVSAALIGCIITKITNRLKGDFFALSTLGLTFVFYSVFLNWKSLTRGPLGIPGIPKPEFFGFTLVSPEYYFVFMLLVCSLVVYLLHRLVNSPYGKLLEALRDDALGLAALGKNIMRLKSQAMMISAFCAGLSGSLYAHYITFIDPSTFFLGNIIIILTIVIVGGLASLPGTIVATMIVVLLPEMLRFLDIPSSVLGPLRQIIYAVIILLVLLYRPRGLFGKVDLP